MSKLIQISDSEWIVMEVLWRLGAASAADVIAELASKKDWNHRTVRTLLIRLVDKGVIDTKAGVSPHVYKPIVRREKCVRQESESFLEKVFAGDATELLIHFVRNSKISPQEIERLRTLLDDKLSDSN